MPMPWFRTYSELLTDRKILRLCKVTKQPKVVIIGFWITLLSIANDSPDRGKLLLTEDMPFTAQDLADETELPIETVEFLLSELRRMAMINLDDKFVLEIANWNKRQTNFDSSAERVRNYRERLKNQIGTITDYSKHRKYIYERDDYKCVYCGSNNNLVLDHLIPLMLGGDSELDNLVTACKKCNSGKAGRTPEIAGYSIINQQSKLQYENVLKRINPVTVTGNNVTFVDKDINKDTEHNKESEKNTNIVVVDDSQNIFTLYESEIGILTPRISEELQEFEETYSTKWVCDAIKIASDNNKRTIPYIKAILNNWKVHGRNHKPSKEKAKVGSDYTGGKFADWIEH